jgi:preflagellin peptidase FlaK
VKPTVFAITAFVFSLAGLLFASFTDFKERIVPDWLNYSLIVLGLALHGVWAIVAKDAWLFGASAAAAIAAFAFGWLLWKLGVWAGGDVKLLTGIAALNPFNYAVTGSLLGGLVPVAKPIGLPVFFLSLFVFSVFAMLPFGAALGVKKLLENKEEKKKFVAASVKRTARLLELGFVAMALAKALALVALPLWLALPLLFAVEFLPKKIRLVAVVALVAFGLLEKPLGFVESALLVALPLVALYFLLGLFFASRRLLKKKVKVAELEEGMVPCKTLVEQNGKIVAVAGLETAKIINHLKANNLQGLLDYLKGPQGRIVCSARKAAGLEKEEIVELKRLARNGAIGKEIDVKMTAPFVPAVLIGYLLLGLLGDLVWLVVFG